MLKNLAQATYYLLLYFIGVALANILVSFHILFFNEYTYLLKTTTTPHHTMGCVW